MQAVILNALSDACDAERSPKGRQGEANRRSARRWLIEAGADFREVCELAGLDANEVRKLALAFLRSGRPFPRMRRDNGRRNRNAIAPAAIAARAGVSTSAVRTVLIHDRGSDTMRALVQRTLRAIAEEQRMAA